MFRFPLPSILPTQITTLHQQEPQFLSPPKAASLIRAVPPEWIAKAVVRIDDAASFARATPRGHAELTIPLLLIGFCVATLVASQSAIASQREQGALQYWRPQ